MKSLLLLSIILVSIITPTVHIEAEEVELFQKIGEIHTGFTTTPGVILSPDGSFLFVSGREVQQIWHVSDQTLLYENQGIIEDFAWSPDAHYLAMGISQDESREVQEIIVWGAEAQTSVVLTTIEGTIYDLNWHPNSNWLVSAIETKDLKSEIRVWDVKTNSSQLIDDTRKFVGNLSLDHVVFSPDGDFLISVGFEKLYFWSVPSYEPLAWFDNLKLCGECIFYLKWSFDNQYLLLGSLGILNLRNEEFISFDDQTFDTSLSSLKLFWSPSSHLLISGNGILYNPVTQETQKLLPLNTLAPVKWTSDGNYVLSINVDEEEIDVWNIQSGELDQEIKFLEFQPRSIDINSSNLLVVGYQDGRIYIYNYKNS